MEIKLNFSRFPISIRPPVLLRGVTRSCYVFRRVKSSSPESVSVAREVPRVPPYIGARSSSYVKQYQQPRDNVLVTRPAKCVADTTTG